VGRFAPEVIAKQYTQLYEVVQTHGESKHFNAAVASSRERSLVR
jgi:hypothetical protein